MKTTEENKIEKSLKKIGVVKLKRYGFIHINKDNIINEEVYRYFFEKILKEEEFKNKGYDNVINKLLQEIETANQKENKCKL